MNPGACILDAFGHETLTERAVFWGLSPGSVSWLTATDDSTLLRQPMASNPILTAGKVRYFTPS